jgi:Fungal specific transcription factor domain
MALNLDVASSMGHPICQSYLFKNNLCDADLSIQYPVSAVLCARNSNLFWHSSLFWHITKLTRFGKQCDQTTPACKRCLKTNRVCPGYRDQLSLLFRDESKAVAHKAKSSAPDSLNNLLSPTPELSFSVSPSPSPSRSQLDLSAEFDVISLDNPYPTGYIDDDEYVLDDDYYASLSLVPMSVDRRQQAICFCFNNFTWLGKGLSGLNLDADVSSTASVAEKAMMKGIVSLGMANLSRMGAPSQSLKMLAQREYSSTLKLTNAAISHPKHATDDATLTAILCMSLFEVCIVYISFLHLYSDSSDRHVQKARANRCFYPTYKRRRCSTPASRRVPACSDPRVGYVSISAQ